MIHLFMRHTSFTAGILLLTAATAEAAPQQLFNKSIIITWSETITEKGEDGKVSTHGSSRERIAYVSSAGRLFVRATTNLPGGQGKYENAPGASPPGSLAFQGTHAMTGTSVFSGFARRLAVSFDANFSGCTATVTYGKSGGPQKWKSPDGKRTYELISIAVGRVGCAIREGNALVQ